MSLVYHITLHSPMGPRLGFLKLPVSGDPPLAAITLLRRQSQVAAQQPRPGEYQLSGQLDSAVGPFDFEASLVIRNGQFDCMAHTGKGTMRLTGVQAEESKEFAHE